MNYVEDDNVEIKSKKEFQIGKDILRFIEVFREKVKLMENI